MKTEKSIERDRVIIKTFLKSSSAEMTYFRDHPELFDDVTAPVNVNKGDTI